MSWRIVRSSLTGWTEPLSDGGGPTEQSDGRILHLILDTEHAANALSESVLEELDAATEQFDPATTDAVVVWSAKEKHFIAGADIDEIDGVHFPETATAKVAKAQAIISKLADTPIPTFGVLRGTCLGGGLELALALDYRIAVDTPTTKLGLPEVNLGIIPGFGGTQRLPRLIGIRGALSLILGGTRLPATAALRRGVVDIVVPEDGYVSCALIAIERVLANDTAIRKRRKKFVGGFVNGLLERNPFGRSMIRRQASRQIAAKTGGHYPAPPAALDAVLRGFATSLPRGLAIEAELIGPLVASTVSKHLIAVFRASEEARKLRQYSDTPEIEADATVGVLGAGVMGAGVALQCLCKGLAVRIRDLQLPVIAKALETIGSHFHGLVQRRRMDERERDATLSRLTFTTEPIGFAHCTAVVEAIVERMDVKRAALAEIEPQLSPDTLFATNTSALSVSELQSSAIRPERVVGLHFFNPVSRMPLVEVIPGDQTSRETVGKAARLAVAMGKYPIVVKDSPGFLVNRLLMPYLDSACRILERGVPGPYVDRIAEAFGLPMGPFRLLDEVGLDIAIEVAGTLHGAFGDRAEPSAILPQLVEKKLIGKKGGVGFYRYVNGTPTEFNADVTREIPQTNDLPESLSVIHYLLDRLIDEAARCLEEGVVASADELDLAMVMGTGFPPFRGGPLRYADSIGIPGIVERLQERADSGEACAPCAHLIEIGKEGREFHCETKLART